MVVDDEAHEPLEEVLGLVFGEPVDLGDVVADAEDALPARDGVGADQRVDGLEDLADVLGRAALGGVDLEVVLVSCLVEAGLGVRGCQGVEEVTEGGRNAVVELVAAGP